MESALDLASIRSDLERTLRRGHRTIEQLSDTVQLAEQLRKAESDKLATTLTRYDKGMIDILEVTRAKQDMDTAELNLLESRIERIIQIARYQSNLPAPPPPPADQPEPVKDQADQVPPADEAPVEADRP